MASLRSPKQLAAHSKGTVAPVGCREMTSVSPAEQNRWRQKHEDNCELNMAKTTGDMGYTGDSSSHVINVDCSDFCA